jgi:hypothetical protein
VTPRTAPSRRPPDTAPKRRAGPAPGCGERRSSVTRRSCNQAGFVAGAESLIFGTLVFVLGTIVVMNAWSALDARFATSAAAREAVRAVVVAPPDADLSEVAWTAAAAALAGHGRDPGDLEVTWLGPTPGPEQVRCGEVRFRVETTVPVLAIPRWGSGAGFQVSAVHAELIEPYRAGVAASVCEP